MQGRSVVFAESLLVDGAALRVRGFVIANGYGKIEVNVD